MDLTLLLDMAAHGIGDEIAIGSGARAISGAMLRPDAWRLALPPTSA
jgi:hypothetical protein